MLSSWTTPRPGIYRGEDCTVLSWQVERCAIVAYVMRDAPRVFIAGGETGDTPVGKRIWKRSKHWPSDLNASI
jgi:hypothetical protein